MSKKMSYVKALTFAIELIGEYSMNDENGNVVMEYPEVVERLEALKVSLEKRGTRKAVGPTKAQKANAELAERIFNAMVADVVYSTNDICGLLPELEGATPQKVSPLMKSLVASERVIAEKVKGKATYRLA